MKKLTIYTDGACSGNPGKGGWAAILIVGDNKKNLSGAEYKTTNNRMELTAVIQSLQSLDNYNDFEIEINTDSKYVKDGIEIWINKWKENGWKTANKKEVKNQDLWKNLDNIIQGKKIKWNWVKGHANNKFNNLNSWINSRLADWKSRESKNY